MEDSTLSLVRFFKKYPKKGYEEGETIVSSGENEGSIFFIETGIARSFYIDENGNELTINLLKPFSLFPLSAVLAGGKNIYNLQAFTTVEVKIAPIPEVLKYLEGDGKVKSLFMKNFAKGLEGYVIRSFFLIKGSALQKVSSTILMLARRFGKPGQKTTTIDLPVTHQNIADLAGITRETASIQIGLLKKEKIIAMKGKRITIFSFESLSQKASENDDGSLINLSF